MLGSVLRALFGGSKKSPEEMFRAGVAAQGAGKLQEAAQWFERAAAAAPWSAGAHNNLGAALRDLGRYDEALAAFERARALDANLAEAHHNAAAELQRRGEYQQAAECYRRVVALRPAWVDAWFELGNMLTGAGETAEALRAFRRALALQPDHARARWAMAMAAIPAIPESEAEVAAARAAFGAATADLERWFANVPAEAGAAAVGVQQPFYLAYQDEDNRALLGAYGSLCAELMGRWQRERGLQPRPAARGARRRIGIVSAHVFNHSVWSMLIRGWLEHLDRGRFEVHVFHLGARDDAETARARAWAGRFVSGERPFAQWAEAVADARLDALVFPEIGMDATTLRLAGLRLSPVQATSLGHPQTSGLPTIDYYLSAEAFEPPQAERHYTERLVRLPRLGCCFAHQRGAAAAPDLAALDIRADAPLLVSPGTPHKYVPRGDALLAEIARRARRCHLILFESRPPALSRRLRERLRRAFASAGADFEACVRFVPWQDRAGFRGWLERADVYLDTVGFSGFNTPMQAIECALPVVTREGRFARGRQASGMLRLLGMDELVAASDEAYVETAARLAQDADARKALRTRLAASGDSVFDDLAPIRGLEDFLIDATK